MEVTLEASTRNFSTGRRAISTCPPAVPCPNGRVVLLLGICTHPREICFRRSKIGRNAEGMFKVLASLLGIPGSRLQNAEVVPSIRVVRSQAKDLLLLGNGLRQLAARGINLRERGVNLRIVRR